MALYNKEQLVVMYGIALVLAGSALWHVLAPAGPEGAAAARQPCSYELAGDVAAPGIYSFSEPQTLAGLLAAAGVKRPEAQVRQTVANGSRVVAGSRVTIEPMRPQDRINCCLPIALSTATVEDLALIPGMGEKTAAEIIAWRDGRGPVQNIAELQQIEGIGPKKLGEFARYITATQ